MSAKSVFACLLLAVGCTFATVSVAESMVPDYQFATSVKVQEMNTLFADDAKLDSAVAWCRAHGIGKIYLETFRFGETIDEKMLVRVKNRFERGGIVTAGLVTPTMVGKPSTSWDVAACYSDEATCRHLADIFAFAARHFDTVLIDDFFFASCDCDVCRAAKGNRDWGEFRRDQMTEIAEKFVLAPARAANPHVKVIVKYPCWYPQYPQRGYDVAHEARIFDGAWAGTETRDWDLAARRGTVPMAAFFLMRWTLDATGGRCGGGWYDPLWTSPAAYLEQARLTILGGAHESVLHSYGYLAFTAEEGRKLGDDVVARLGLKGVGGLGSTNGPACCAAFRRELPALRALADEVARRHVTGVAVWKPVNASEREDDRWYERLAMTGIPIDPRAEFPADAPAAAFSSCVLDHPGADGLVSRYVATGRPVLLSRRLAAAWKGKPWLAAANVYVVPEDLSSWEFCDLPTDRLTALRGRVLPALGVSGFRAPNRVGLILFTDGSRVFLNFDDVPARIELGGTGFTLEPHGMSCVWTDGPLLGAAAEAPDPCVRSFVDPVRVVWCSSKSVTSSVTDAGILLERRRGQVPEGRFPSGSGCLLENKGAPAGVLVDFGRELHGGLRLASGARSDHGMKVRVRFGESVAEAMSEPGERNAGNDHAIRDGVIDVPWFGTRETGNTGFRFVRIDLVTPGKVSLESLRAVSLMRPLVRRGAFACDDARLNAIWDTAARTVQLCCQDYIWDGIKRDRLVWMGDLHPEIAAVLAVFGAQDVVPRSLDYMRDTTPADQWMNGMPSYTLWWIRGQYEWYRQTGDLAYLRTQHDYLKAVMAHLDPFLKDGACALDGFLDWPNQANRPAVASGMQALALLAYREGGEMARALGDADLERTCAACAARLEKSRPDAHGSKAAAALLALSGLRTPREMADTVLLPGGTRGFSTFYGYYMLQALSAAGEDRAAIGLARDYWGGMLDMGATSFWEDFDPAWTNNAFRIDELPVPGKKDIHGDFGAYCYRGFRHSLCHGWSSGPAAWLIHDVLGIQPLDPGCRHVRIAPRLGDLRWAEGALPVPQGVIRVRVERHPDGTQAPPRVTLPPGVTRIP